MLALNENPPMLPPDLCSVSELVGTLWVAHTKSRFEKQFVRHLQSQGVGYFLPLLPSYSFSGGRRRTALLPMFPSYVFFAGEADQRYAALASNCLCTVMPCPDQGRLRSELRAIEQAMLNVERLEPVSAVPVGQRCRVIAGSLSGCEGVVTEHAGRRRLVLQVSMLGSGVALEVDFADIEIVD